jgi:hypothetical protein
LVTDGKQFFWLERIAGLYFDSSSTIGYYSLLPGRDGGGGVESGPPLNKAAYLRLKRWDNFLEAEWSEDGRKWTAAEHFLRVPGGKLPRKLKVGVFAQADVEGPFTAVFDEWRLTEWQGKD